MTNAVKLIFFALAFVGGIVHAKSWSPTVTWQEVTKREDGKPLPKEQIKEYRLLVTYPDERQRLYKVTETTQRKLRLFHMSGIYVFTVQVCDTDNLCSDPSEPTYFEPPPNTLDAPTNGSLD